MGCFARHTLEQRKTSALPARGCAGPGHDFSRRKRIISVVCTSAFYPAYSPGLCRSRGGSFFTSGGEARHIDVFLKRGRLCGVRLGISSVTTSRSLLSLLQIDDFTEATFLLSVLGEGTFLDLLSFIERHAPDDATAELTRRAKNDESRHR